MRGTHRDSGAWGRAALDRAQSNVIGAILLIVVTIILVSFVSVYVFDVGSQLQGDTPQASFTFDNTSAGLIATHDGGENVLAQNVQIVVTDDGNTPTAVALGETPSAGGTTRADADDAAIFGPGTIRVGDSAEVADNVGDDDEVRIVYLDPDSDQGTTLARYEG